MRYLISYDLANPGQDYKLLADELKRLGAEKVLLSQWVVRRTNTSTAGIRDHLKSFIDSNDRLLVVALDGTGWAGWNLLTKINNI